jgi:hypothetical protein
MGHNITSQAEIEKVETDIRERIKSGESIVIESRRTSAPKLTRDGGVIWLHVSANRIRVLLAQKAWSDGWASTDQAGNNRTGVGKLHLELNCSIRQEDNCQNCSGLEITEYSTSDTVAIGIAQCWGPDIGPIQAQY